MERWRSTHASGRTVDLVDDVSKHDVLVVSLDAHLLPLHVLSEPKVVAEERVAYAVSVNRIAMSILQSDALGIRCRSEGGLAYLLGYDAFLSLNMMLAVTFSLILFLDV
jgi:hypothetical protein